MDEFVHEDDIQRLLDNSPDKQKLADKQRAQISKAEFHKIRALCKRDLFFLCYSILGNKRLSPNLHGNLCRQLYKTRHERFHGFLMPRGHFKSTILTIGHSIQIALPYTEEDAKYDDFRDEELAWPDTLGTDVRLLIGHETAESASRFLYAITSHFTGNPTLMAFFPEAIPSARRQRINKWELELPRSESARGNPEPTFDTLGVGGKSQGRHYNYIKLDDIFGDKARDSFTEAATTIQWFDNIQSFFSKFSEDHLDLTGTRYSHDDVYNHAMEVYGKQMKWYNRKVEEIDEAGVKSPIFPEEFTPETLAIIKRNKKVYSAQYENDPYESGSGFDPDWKRYFYWTGHNELAVFEGALGEGKKKINVRDLDVCILIDPGEVSGGFVVTGMDYQGKIYTLVAFGIDMKPPQLVDTIFKNVIRWQPRTVAIESDIFANVYQYWLAAEMPRRGVRFHISPVVTKKRAKNLRISGLSPYAEAGLIHINEKQTELESEWAKWGKTQNIHILDALAYGPEIWRPGYAPGQRELIENAGAQQDDPRDVITGYSEIA